MRKVTPREFRDAFMAVMQSEQASLRTAMGFEPKSYAYYMRSSIFPKIAKQLGMLAWNKEYHTLDGMFYEERGTDRSGNYSSYAKWISVALEHDPKGIKTQEKINKLQIFNAPLKVLITYGAGVEVDSLLRQYASIISDADLFEDIATARQQLVIFGTPKTARNWSFYVYENDGFVLMLPASSGR